MELQRTFFTDRKWFWIKFLCSKLYLKNKYIVFCEIAKPFLFDSKWNFITFEWIQHISIWSTYQSLIALYNCKILHFRM